MVVLDENERRMGRSNKSRSSIRFNSGGFSAPGSTPMARSSNAADGSPSGQGKQGLPTPSPNSMKVAASWQAHEDPIVSLVSTTNPPALVSTDVKKQVKV